MAITAAMVKELRDRTGAGMMECKKALTAADGDMETAAEQMRISGLAKADKKAGNTAAEGVVEIRLSDDGKKFAMVEINSQTDFAAKSEDFIGEEARKALVAKIGENIQVRRFEAGDAKGDQLAQYSHSGRIGVVVDMKGGDEALARDVAMHIAASKPVCVDETGVPADMLEKEKSILMAEAAESGKPAEIVEKMVGGRIKKYLADITLVGQPFVKDPDQTVEQMLKAAGAEVIAFHRLEVGEGIEKKVENFADEVMAQVRGNDDDSSDD